MKAKAPRARVYRGDLGGAPNQGRHPRPLEIGAQQKVFKKGAGGLKLIRSWRIKKKKHFLNRNASTKQPFHIDRRRMNFVNKLLAFLLILISFSLLRVLFSFYSRPGPFLDRLLKHLLIPHVLSEPPTHSITCL